MTRRIVRAIMTNAPRPAARSGLTADIAVACSIVAALLLWWVSLPLIDPEKLDDFGLVAIVPWQYWAALALLPVGFSFSLYHSPQRSLLPLAALTALVIILHATPAIVYGTLRYSWAWKHIGVVDYIQRYGEVNRTISFLSAYHNWPGFFWISAKIADQFHLGPIELANWVRFFPVLSNLVFVFLLHSIYRKFTDDSRLVFAAMWIFVCTNWVGQDYFSPQAFAYALHLLILALCLGPLMPVSGSGRAWPSQRMRDKFTQDVTVRPSFSTGQQIVAIIVTCLAILVMVASHQLTPLILVFSLIGLAMLGRLSIGIPILAGLALLFWAIYPAAPFTAATLPGELSRLGQTVGGVAERLVDTSHVTTGFATVVWVGRALSAGVAAVGVLGWLRRMRLGQRDGVICVLLVAPTLILGVTSYGGEAIFRIYFFCLPFFAFFCASFFFPRKDKGTAPAAYIGFAALILLFSIGFLFGNNGKDRQYRFSQSEIDAAIWLYSRSTPDTLLVELARNYPSQFVNYENFIYLPISEEPVEERAKILENAGEVLEDWFSDPKWQDGYVILTRSQMAFLQTSGIIPQAAQDKFARDVSASPDLVRVYENKDARIFRARRFLSN
jgi:hypothetical protein